MCRFVVPSTSPTVPEYVSIIFFSLSLCLSLLARQSNLFLNETKKSGSGTSPRSLRCNSSVLVFFRLLEPSVFVKLTHVMEYKEESNNVKFF